MMTPTAAVFVIDASPWYAFATAPVVYLPLTEIEPLLPTVAPA